MRIEEVSQISFSLGLLALAIPLNIFLLCVEDTQWLNREPVSDIGNWLNIGFIFRFFLFADIIIFGTASVVHILKLYKINYIYIFEIEPQYQVTHWQLYSFGLLLFLVLNICLLIQLIIFKFYYILLDNSKIPTILLIFISLLGVMLNPLRVLYWI